MAITGRRGTFLALAAAASFQAVPTLARAQGANPSISAVDNSASFSWLLSRMYYVEPNDGYVTTPSGYLDAETGNISGPKLALSALTRNNYYFHADGSWGTGKVAYSGYFQGGPPFNPAVGRSNATVWEGNLRVGKGFVVGSRWLLTPFLGGGRRYWAREVGAGTQGSFVESYNFFYYALGGMAQYSPSERWVFTADVTVARTSDASINVPPAGLNHTALGTSLLKKAGGEVDYRVAGAVHLFAAFDYEAFSFGESALQQFALEPYSKTQLYNFNLGVRYSFQGLKPRSDWDSTFSF